MQNIYSDSWGTDLAKIFKGYENRNRIGPTLGTIKRASPLTIEIIQGEVVINSSIHDIFISDTLSKKAYSAGDTVLVIPDTSDKIFFIVDKIEKAGG